MSEPFAASVKGGFKPFLIGEALAANERASFHPESIGEAVPVLISDNLLADRRPMRAVLRDSYAPNWKLKEGGRNFVDYYDCRHLFAVPDLPLFQMVRKAIRHFYAIDTEMHGPGLSSNWFMQINRRRSDFAVPHSDHDAEGHIFTIIHFLNDPEECSGGTGFFRHKGSGRIQMRANQRQAFYREHPRLIEDGGDYWVGGNLSEWEMIGTVAMKPGRTLIFPAEFFHAAHHPDDLYMEFPRLNVVHWERVVAGK
jgi:hypothetical protein